METVKCSKEVYDVLVAFNNLPSLEQQEEVLDVIYDALHKRKIEDVLNERLDHSLNLEYERVKSEVVTLENRLAAQQILKERESKKNLRKAKRGLLVILNNIKHFLGDSWETVLPGGMQEVDSFISNVDTEHVMSTNTWSEYETDNDSDNDPDNEYF